MENLRKHVEATSLRRRQQLDHLRRFAAEADRELSPQPRSTPSMLRSPERTSEQPREPERHELPWWLRGPSRRRKGGG